MDNSRQLCSMVTLKPAWSFPIWGLLNRKFPKPSEILVASVKRKKNHNLLFKKDSKAWFLGKYFSLSFNSSATIIMNDGIFFEDYKTMKLATKQRDKFPLILWLFLRQTAVQMDTDVLQIYCFQTFQETFFPRRSWNHTKFSLTLQSWSSRYK